MHSLLVLLASFCALQMCVSIVSAQIKPSRTWLVDMARRGAAVGEISNMMAGIEVGRSGGSFQQEQAWQMRLHTVLEPYRFTSIASLKDEVVWTTSLEFHQELTANPLNNIGFNPRTARWEEQLLVHAATPNASARGGWFHRCKHDIDNSDPPNEDATGPYSPVRRTLILSGPTLGAMHAPVQHDRLTLRLAAAAEYYVINEDYRSPTTSTTGSWKGMHGAVWMRAEATWHCSSSFTLGVNSYMSIPWFSSRYGIHDNDYLTCEARAEMVGSFVTQNAAMDLVLSAEHTFDEVAFLSPTPSTYVQFGIRFRSR